MVLDGRGQALRRHPCASGRPSDLAKIAIPAIVVRGAHAQPLTQRSGAFALTACGIYSPHRRYAGSGHLRALEASRRKSVKTTEIYLDFSSPEKQDVVKGENATGGTVTAVCRYRSRVSR